MKKHLPAFVLLGVFIVLANTFGVSGCTQLLRIQAQAAQQAANGIAEYCKNTDETFRAKFRDDVNKIAAPNSVEIICGTQ